MQQKLLQHASFAVFFLKLLWQFRWTNTEQRYTSHGMVLSHYLKSSKIEQFYSGYLPGLLTTGDNKRTSRWEILHRKITRPWKGKLLGLGSPSFRVLLAPRISRGHFSLAVFFRVTHDGLSERGTNRSLAPTNFNDCLSWKLIIFCLRNVAEPAESVVFLLIYLWPL